MTSTTTGPSDGGGLVLVDGGERGLQPRDADGEAGGRHLGAEEALDQAVVAAAAADRAEAHGLAVLVDDGDGDLGFEDGAGVVLEAADDGGIDANAILAISGCFDSARNCFKFVEPIASA